MANVGIKTVTFSEALDLLKNEHTSFMIRAKWLKNNDFVNRIIVAHNLKQYIKHDWSYVEGRPKILRMAKKKKDGSISSSYACIESDDILADDWVDLREWKVVTTQEEYEEEIRKIRKTREGFE